MLHIADGKRHLSALPPYLPNPFPVYDDSSKELIILFPLFLNEENDLNLFLNEPHLKSAIWSRWSYYRNSDIIEKNIPIKFYIQNSLYKHQAKYLKSQGIYEKDCVLFDTSQTPLEPEYHKHNSVNLGLKVLPMCDERFSGYKRVIIHDADLFLCKTETASSLYPMLDFLKFIPEDKIGVFWTNHMHSFDDTTVPTNWLYRMKDDSEELWYEIARNFLPIDFPYQWDDERGLCSDNGVMYIYSPEHCTPEFKTFCKTAVQKFRDDEAVISMWHQNHRDSVVKIGDQINYVFDEGDLLELSREKVPFYFSHLYLTTEYLWRQHIGAI